MTKLVKQTKESAKSNISRFSFFDNQKHSYFKSSNLENDNLEGTNSGNYLLKLQQTAGNQAVQLFIKKAGIQTKSKLKVISPSDIYEQEADRVAEQVMNVHFDNRIGGPISGGKIGRKCQSCKEEEEKKMLIHRKVASEG